jgi:hypothetical protein
MALNLNEIFSPAAIAAYWTNDPTNAQPYASDALFPARKKVSMELKWLRGHKGVGVSLKPSVFDTKATFRTRQGIKMTETSMPFFREGTHIDCVLDDFAHDFRAGHGLVAVIEHKIRNEHGISVHISNRTGGKVTATPCNIHDHELAIRLTIRQNAVNVSQFIGREQQTFTHIRLAHVLCPPCCIVNAGFHVGIVGIIKSHTVIVVEVTVSVLVHRRNQ